MTVSVICCYNNDEQYSNMCVSLTKQDTSYELIGVNNKDNIFLSAASALNYGAAKATGEILVFIHQDILFTAPDSLRRLASAAENVGGGIGIAGAFHGERENLLDGLVSAETLDECCVAMPRNVWERNQFNEKVCDGWHLYVVEFCLRVGSNLPVAYGDFGITHLSNGNVDEAYMKKFRELIEIYKDKGWIATTCKSLPTNLLAYYVYYSAWKIKKTLLGNFPLTHSIKRLIKG